MCPNCEGFHELIINIDQTGIKLVPTGDWTMAACGSKRVEDAGLGDKWQIIATFGASINGLASPVPRQDRLAAPYGCISRRF